MGNYVSKSTSAEAENGRKAINHKLICENTKEKLKYINLFALVLALAFSFVTALFAFIVLIEAPFGDFRDNILIALFLALPTIIALLFILNNFKILCEINNKEYTIIPDSVTRIEEKIDFYSNISLLGQGNFYYMMYLFHFGKIEVRKSDMDTNEIGDTIYVVVHKKRPKKALLWYNSKYYEPEI